MITKKSLLCAAALLALSACDDSDGDGASNDTPDATAQTPKDAGVPDAESGGDKSLCAKYGGAANIEKVIKEKVVGEIAGDCRINTFFTTLPEPRLTRVADCLAIQGQELFGCPGIKYAGSKASNDLPCRDMKTSHMGLAISDADFAALIEDVAAGLTKAGVSSEDIGAAAPALLGLKPDIVEGTAMGTTKSICDAGTGN